MKSFQQLLKAVTSSSYFDQMVRFAKPLDDHFAINHFWYYRITSKGTYSYLGTHAAWSEFCFVKSLIALFPCLRHPDTMQSGIHLMKASSNVAYQSMLEEAWNSYRLNFSINLLTKVPDGIEAFGFATRHNDPKADERLLNELSSLRHFTQQFRLRFGPLFALLEDNQVDIAAQFGSIFYEQPSSILCPIDRKAFLHKIGCGWIYTLTPREQDVLMLLANGYSASYIGQSLAISCRTVENYIATLKSKLYCDSKLALIQKANDFVQLRNSLN